MEGGELLCNYRRCRRLLDGIAWVTFCSHIFCDEDGSQLLKIPSECRACGAKLTVKSDVVKVDLDPSEQFRSMVLAGLQPEIVMEVCHRSINFWSYQMEQERSFQRHISKRLRERLQDVQNYYEQQLRSRDDQIETLRRQVDGSRHDLDKCREQKEIINEKLGEKSRQCQRLRSMYDSLRKRTGASMTDDWITYQNSTVPAITNNASSYNSVASTSIGHVPPPPPPPPPSIDMPYPRNSSSFRPLPPPPLPHLDLADPQPSISSGIRHRRRSNSDGGSMEMVISDKGLHNHPPSTYGFPPENPELQVIPSTRHQQPPSDTHLQKQHSYVANKSHHPLHGPLPVQVLPRPPSRSPGDMYSNQTSQPASSGHLMAPPPPSLQPMSYDDFVFAPILHGNRREGSSSSSSNRRSCNSNGGHGTAAESRHHR